MYLLKDIKNNKNYVYTNESINDCLNYLKEQTNLNLQLQKINEQNYNIYNVIEKQGCCPCEDIIESGETCFCPSKFAEKYECDPLELLEEATEILARKESLDYLLEAKLLFQEEIEFKVEHDNS